MYVLDTDTFSNLIIRSRNYPALRNRFLQQPSHTLFISIILVDEMLKAILPLIQREWNTPKIVGRYADLQDFLAELQQIQILPFDDAAYQKFIRIPNALRHPHPRDCRLAAIALSRGFTVVTRNTRHFAGIPGSRVVGQLFALRRSLHATTLGAI